MTGTDRIPSGGFNVLVPEFDVFDLDASVRFWCDTLSFGVAYFRTESGFVYLQREGAQVMLNRINGTWDTAPLERPLGRGINVQFNVSSVACILTRLDACGWPLFRPLHDAWYRAGDRQVGCRQFLVQDPDGYLLRFAESLGDRDLTPGGPVSSP